MRGIELKHIGVRSFMLKGLTARWGVDGDRPPMPPALRTALVAWYNTEIQRATNFDVIESYADDFTTWAYNTSRGTLTRTPSKVVITEAKIANAIMLYDEVPPYKQITVRVTGTTRENPLRVNTTPVLAIKEDGIYTIQVVKYMGFSFGTVGAVNVTIEQLPTSKLTDLSGNGHHLHLYGYTGTPTNGINADGWLQSAGVGYGVSYGQPILTDYTVCSTREWINPANDKVFASKSSAPGNGAFIFEYIPNSTYSFGIETISALTVPNGFSYQTKTSYNGIRALTVGTGLDTDHLVVGRIRLKDQPRSFHGGYKSFVLFNRTLTTEELAYVRRWMA